MLRAARGATTKGHSDHRDIMSLAGLLSILNDDPQLHDIFARQGAAEERAGNAGAGQDLVAPPGLRPVIAAALAAGDGADALAAGDGVPADGTGFVLAVTATAAEADELAAGLSPFLPPDSIATFPGWETLPHERLSPRSDTVGRRIAVLRRLAPPGAAGGGAGGAPADGPGAGGRGAEADTVGQRIAVLRRLAPPGAAGDELGGPLRVVVAPVRSVLQPIVAGLGDLEPVRLAVGGGGHAEGGITPP